MAAPFESEQVSLADQLNARGSRIQTRLIAPERVGSDGTTSFASSYSFARTIIRDAKPKKIAAVQVIVTGGSHVCAYSNVYNPPESDCPP
jgi:hypothetical protein